ncbi:MAG: hypothetical protein RIT43_1328, partial [Bacteroidota bacterium]
MNKNKIKSFYDNFINYQKESNVNERIFSLYKKTRRYGLNKYSNVLELGSGIGTMTCLISKTVTKGRIETVEISPNSVDYAKKHIKKKNIRFFTSDIIDYKPELKRIDFITL